MPQEKNAEIRNKTNNETNKSPKQLQERNAASWLHNRSPTFVSSGANRLLNWMLCTTFVRLGHAVYLNTWNFWVEHFQPLLVTLKMKRSSIHKKVSVWMFHAWKQCCVSPHLCRCVLTQFLWEVAFILCPFSTTPWLVSCERDIILSTGRQTQSLFS